MSVMPGRADAMINLEYPQSVVVVDDYETAQKIVDELSDKEFPVENLCIVGTDLKTMERVTVVVPGARCSARGPSPDSAWVCWSAS